MRRFYASLMRVTYGWSSFLMPNGSKELWQAAVYLTGAYVLGAIFLISGPFGSFVEEGTRGHVCAVIGVAALIFNYRFAVKHSDAIRQKSRPASAILAHLLILSMISAGAATIFFP